MDDIASPEQLGHSENYKKDLSKSEQKPLDKSLITKMEPRVVTFGSIEVQEDFHRDLVSPEEKELYQKRFKIYKDIYETVADNNIAKAVLTSPDVVSGIVGYQPLVSMHTGEAAFVYQSFLRTGFDFDEDYSFLEFGQEKKYTKILVNNRAAEFILKKYKTELGIQLPEGKMTNDEVNAAIIKLLNARDVKKANLAHGLLSGFPLEDCVYAVEGGRNFTSIDPLRIIKDPKKRFLEIDSIAMLYPDDYKVTGSKNRYLPDTRERLKLGGMDTFVEGFGLRWFARLPTRESTINHCQKILQVDREIGLLNFVNRQRASFNIEDGVQGIKVANRLAKDFLISPNTRKVLKKAAHKTFKIFFWVDFVFNGLKSLVNKMFDIPKQPHQQ